MALCDHHTLANYTHWRSRHLVLDLKVCFRSKTLAGFVELELEALQENQQVVLDTEHLDIEKAALFTLQAPTLYGSALVIELDRTCPLGAVIKLHIQYRATSKSTGLQFLEPAQTQGKRYPYLFTQFQPIFARGMVPCQDTPLYKVTYAATIHVEQPLVALMSALRSEPVASVYPNHLAYAFTQPVPMATYLIALAVGHLQSVELGPRTSVWTEPDMLEQAAWEFADTDKFIRMGEQLLTPYAWTRYDLLVLPPSFPYGGMENPCLTFVTPTLLAGDRSLVDVIVHEISHSWTGNLVTNATWEHFWLNEGWTVFLERKILARLHGEAHRQLSSIVGWKDLQEAVDLFHSNEMTRLLPPLNNLHPDDAFSTVPYEKGYNLLYTLEQLVGQPFFERFMKAYIQHFSGQSITTQHWKDFLLAFANQHNKTAWQALQQFDWDSWLHQPGMPPVSDVFDRALAAQADQLAQAWDRARDNRASLEQFAASDIAGFSGMQTLVFLGGLQALEPFSPLVLQTMDAVYMFSQTRNSEIRYAWCGLCLKASYEPIFPLVTAFVTEQGRMKFVRPLYRALFQCARGRALALETFQQHRAFYHPIAAKMIAGDLQLE